MYQSSDLQKFFNRSPETIRQWADEFATYLSELANPPEGVHRRYDEQDLLVFALVNKMREQKATNEEIHEALGRGDRGEVPVAAFFKENGPDLAVKLYQANTELDNLRKRLEEAEAKLATTSEENIRLKTRLEEMEKRIELEREVATLKARLEAMEKKV
jgi:DNA-binding transcriptional MerR regulator